MSKKKPPTDEPEGPRHENETTGPDKPKTSTEDTPEKTSGMEGVSSYRWLDASEYPYDGVSRVTLPKWKRSSAKLSPVPDLPIAEARKGKAWDADDGGQYEPIDGDPADDEVEQARDAFRLAERDEADLDEAAQRLALRKGISLEEARRELEGSPDE